MTASVGQVRRVFARAGVELDARQLAEALWLAQHLPDADEAAAPPDVGALPTVRVAPHAADALAAEQPAVDGPSATPEDTTGSDLGGGPPDPPPERLPVHLRPPATARTDATQAIPLLAPAAPAIPAALRLMRALRPLKRTVASRYRVALDEEATARQIAERRIWLPVLQPAREPWLDLVLVADLSAGGQLWDRIATELYAMFRRLGAFRDVRLRHLRTDATGTPWLTASGRLGAGTPRSPSEILDPTGRRLILVLTDGVGEAWRDGRLPTVVRRWARSGPVAILQPLPAHLWERTALRPRPGRLRTPGPGVPNNRLSFTSYRRRTHPRSPDAVPIPVLEIAPEWLGPWARLISGNADRGVDASAILVGSTPPGSPSDSPTAVRREPLDAIERVRAFRAEATPEAYELVTYLSAAPLTLPLMRTIHAAMMPGSSPAHLAEILFSGLVTTVTGTGPTDDDRYEFVDGVRDVLLGTLHRHEAERVDQEVSAFIERRLRLPGARLAAAVPAPSGELILPEESQPFAHLRAEILARVVGLSAPATAPERRDDTAEDGTADPDATDPVQTGAALELANSQGADDTMPMAAGAPPIAEVLDAEGIAVGTGFMVGTRYVATCAHTVNASLGVDLLSETWPSRSVSVRLNQYGGDRYGGAAATYTAAVAAWPPHTSTFDQLDVAILRIEGESPPGAPVAAPLARPEIGETVEVAVGTRVVRGVIASGDPAGLLRLRLAVGTPALPLVGASGAPVYRPSTGQIVGLVNRRIAPDVPGQVTILSAGVVQQVVIDYLQRPQRPPGPVSPADTPRQGRHALPTSESVAAPVENATGGWEATQFLPLNEVERQLLNAGRPAGRLFFETLLSAPVWAAGVASHAGTIAEAIYILDQARPPGVAHIVLVTAPERIVYPAAGPWPFQLVAAHWPPGTSLRLNPHTSIGLELTGHAVRALAQQGSAGPETTGGGERSQSSTEPDTATRGRRFNRRLMRRGYQTDQVDDFAERLEQTLAQYRRGERPTDPVTAQEVHDVVFPVRFNGYDEWQVDLWLDRMERTVQDLESG